MKTFSLSLVLATLSTSLVLAPVCKIMATTTTSQGLPGQPSQPHQPPQTQPKKPKKKEKPYVSKPLHKELLPKMDKPFGMPGVVGWQNGKWQGSDYLGLLSSHISVSVEVLEAEKAPKVNGSALTITLRDIFTKDGLTPEADVEEGPLLPFFHVLVIIYPATPEESLIYVSGRLFESIDVKRKDFEPKGYWQGITWETQDITRVGNKTIEEEAKKSVEKVASSFVKRYREYNPENPDLPKPPVLKNATIQDEK